MATEVRRHLQQYTALNRVIARRHLEQYTALHGVNAGHMPGFWDNIPSPYDVSNSNSDGGEVHVCSEEGYERWKGDGRFYVEAKQVVTMYVKLQNLSNFEFRPNSP